MQVIRKYSSIIMVIVIFREIALPYYMGFFSDRTQVYLLSDLGQPRLAISHSFDVWEIIDGILFILAAQFIYEWGKKYSAKIGIFLTCLVIMYGIGDCIMTALFVYSGSAFSNWHSLIHSTGSVIGCGALYLANFIIIKLLYDEGMFKLAYTFLVTQVISIFVSIMLELPISVSALISGILQCVALDLMYIPMLILSIITLSKGFNYCADNKKGD